MPAAPGSASEDAPATGSSFGDNMSSQGGEKTMALPKTRTPILYLVDEMPLTRAQLSHFLAGFAQLHGMRIEEIEPSDPAFIDQITRRGMCIVNTRSTPRAHDWFSIVRRISQLGLVEPILLLCETASAEFVQSALKAGARGVIPASMNPSNVLNSLELVLHGGIVVPPSVLDNDLSPPLLEDFGAKQGEPDGSPDDTDTTPKGTPPKRNGHELQPRPTQGDQDEAAKLEGLTERQSAVLMNLTQARSNKEIAKVLCTSEATVKLEVRQVIRKLGAKNRTEAALIASALEWQDVEAEQDAEPARAGSPDRGDPPRGGAMDGVEGLDPCELGRGGALRRNLLGGADEKLHTLAQPPRRLT